MYSASGRSAQRSLNAWPGWVDALSSLIMVVIFLLMIFVVAQFYLASALSGRDEAVERLNRQITELGDLLNLERLTNNDLRTNVSQLTTELQGALTARDETAATLGSLRAERDDLAARFAALAARSDASSGQVQQLTRDLEEAYRVVSADREQIEQQLKQISSLQADIQTLGEVRRQLEGEVAALAAAAKDTEERQRTLTAEAGALRDRSRELEAQLASEQERTALAQKEIDQRDVRIRDLMAAVAQAESTLGTERDQTLRGQQQITLLNQQIAALRDQLTKLNTALQASEAKNAEQQVQIVDLGKRLNVALATKVEELAGYRSEFFGRLRETLGDRPDIRIVGDRFVFQSEVLFGTASANLEEQGKGQLGQLARTLLEIAQKIPPEVNWVLRVDGHTDRRPISTAQFPSNWELSTARAISVVKHLTEQGIPAERLAAAGFGEYQPLDPGYGDESFSRNRRIEIKLDQR